MNSNPEIERLLLDNRVLQLQIDNIVGDLNTSLMFREDKFKNDPLKQFEEFKAFYFSDPKEKFNFSINSNPEKDTLLEEKRILQLQIDNIVRDIETHIMSNNNRWKSDPREAFKEFLVEKQQKERLSKLAEVLGELDKDNTGEIALIENDFPKLLNKYQKKVIEIDKNYIHQFVKISNYIKQKKANTQKIFESIKEANSAEELMERVNLLKNQVHTYELLVFHSINMIGSLVKEDLITFYEIYESFDKLGMFNSNWENEVSEKLTNIGDKLDGLMESIYQMENKLVNELSNLAYITQESFQELNLSVTHQLKEIESSINTNNLLSTIQTYQLYKINKQTKGLNT